MIILVACLCNRIADFTNASPILSIENPAWFAHGANKFRPVAFASTITVSYCFIGGVAEVSYDVAAVIQRRRISAGILIPILSSGCAGLHVRPATESPIKRRRQIWPLCAEIFD